MMTQGRSGSKITCGELWRPQKTTRVLGVCHARGQVPFRTAVLCRRLFFSFESRGWHTVYGVVIATSFSTLMCGGGASWRRFLLAHPAASLAAGKCHHEIPGRMRWRRWDDVASLCPRALSVPGTCSIYRAIWWCSRVPLLHTFSFFLSFSLFSFLFSLFSVHFFLFTSVFSLSYCLFSLFLFHFSFSLFLPQPVSTAGTDEKKSPPTTASVSGDEGAGDSTATAALSAEGSEGGGSVDGSSSRGGGKEGSTSSAAEASSSSAVAAAAAAAGEAPSSSAQSGSGGAEDGAASAPGASRWGGKKSFLDVSGVGRVCVLSGDHKREMKPSPAPRRFETSSSIGW